MGIGNYFYQVGKGKHYLLEKIIVIFILGYKSFFKVDNENSMCGYGKVNF